ncbi:MAG: hypothetical protein IPJ40_04545 [Saprospirales bacterium]|nr:hypothetical protein [Saprospirales bacterium]
MLNLPGLRIDAQDASREGGRFISGAERPEFSVFIYHKARRIKIHRHLVDSVRQGVDNIEIVGKTAGYKDFPANPDHLFRPSGYLNGIFQFLLGVQVDPVYEIAEQVGDIGFPGGQGEKVSGRGKGRDGGGADEIVRMDPQDFLGVVDHDKCLVLPNRHALQHIAEG